MIPNGNWREGSVVRSAFCRTMRTRISTQIRSWAAIVLSMPILPKFQRKAKFASYQLNVNYKTQNIGENLPQNNKGESGREGQQIPFFCLSLCTHTNTQIHIYYIQFTHANIKYQKIIYMCVYSHIHKRIKK